MDTQRMNAAIRRATCVAPLALMVAGCATADPWPGAYDGTSETAAVDCTTGEPTSAPRILDIAIAIERGDRGLFIADDCPIFLDALSDGYAEVLPTACDTSRDDGTPVHIEIVSGSLSLDGDVLTGSYTADATSGTRCVSARAELVLVRRE